MDSVVVATPPAAMSRWRAGLQPTLRNRLVVFGGILVAALIVLAVFAGATS